MQYKKKKKVSKNVRGMKGIGFGLVDIAMIGLVLIGVIWLVSTIGSTAGIDLKATIGSSQLKPVMPVYEYLEDASNKSITLPLGLLAFLLIIFAFVSKL